MAFEVVSKLDRLNFKTRIFRLICFRIEFALLLHDSEIIAGVIDRFPHPFGISPKFLETFLVRVERHIIKPVLAAIKMVFPTLSLNFAT
ncbi:Uncharacterised protein [Vibrio cholerae]|uniref:Uncharacterized protein n=1 Tax=Vibrio cholerae TaxID=666 RepID=A0A655RFT0_VIBCL|nr:Uncharacterised protein [Vibrio cholerae]CSB86056.1 Uncharacterised protein [Vibrio cholerae]CSC79905.1 Uncharacterised protein [Vibrio cholerae]